MTAVDGLVIFAGGQENGPAFANSSVVDIYNTATNRWSTTALPEAAAFLSATSAGDDALFAFGSEVQIYDARSAVWSTASLAEGRSDLAATNDGNLAFFAGGTISSANGTFVCSDDVDIFNSPTDQWSLTHLPSGPRRLIAATSADGLAFFAGGATPGGDDSSEVDIYNPATGQWSSTSLPHSGTAYAASSIGDYALFYGRNSVNIYDAQAGQWLTPLAGVVRLDHVGATAGNEALFPDFDLDLNSFVDVYTEASAPGSLSLSGAIGTPHKGGVATVLTNDGPDALDTPFYVDVYASPGRTFGSSSVLLGGVRSQALLNTGGSLDFNVPITVPDSLAAGNYHFISTVYSGGQQVQFASTRQTFALAGSSAARPAILQPMLSTPTLGTFVPNPWLADSANVLEG